MGRITPRPPPSPPPSSPLPLATMIQQRGAWRLAAVDDVAARAGLTPGMPLADARARLPDLDTRPADAKGDRAALTRLAHWAGRYTPWTNIDNGADDGDTKIGTPPAAGLWLDVTGCAHLFGGEDAFLADLCRRLKSAGYPARAGPWRGSGRATPFPGDGSTPGRKRTPWRTCPWRGCGLRMRRRKP